VVEKVAPSAQVWIEDPGMRWHLKASHDGGAWDTVCGRVATIGSSRFWAVRSGELGPALKDRCGLCLDAAIAEVGS
jgi:hypothetical protein